MSTYKETWPAGLYDVAATETWLEERAAQGYQLVRRVGLSGEFVWAKPCRCRYRLEPLLRREKEPESERRELYRAVGWEYVTTVARTYHVWRCDDPAVPELDTDPVAQSHGYRHLRRRMARSLLTTLGQLVMLAALMLLAWGSARTPLLDMVERQAPGVLTFWLAALGFAAVMAFREERESKRLLRRLETGIPLERPAPYRLQQWLGRIGRGVCVGVLAVILSNELFGEAVPIARLDGSLPPRAVTLNLAALTPDQPGEAVCVGASVKRHELAPAQYGVSQSMTALNGPETYCHTDYYRMLTPGLAKRLEEDVEYWYEQFDGPQPGIRIETDALDSFWWSRGTEGRQFAVIRLGRCVLAVQYAGGADLRSCGAELADTLRP